MDSGLLNPLITGLTAGNALTYAALYDRLGASLLRVATAMLHDTGDAEDTVQDVFVELVRRRDRFPQVVDLQAYVFAMLRHAVSRKLEKRRKELAHLHRLALAGERAPPPPPPDDDLQAALGRLPPAQREIVVLKTQGDLTFAQIGEIMNLSPNTAASRYRYALEKLRQALKEKI